jgi:hypothetical protein
MCDTLQVSLSVCHSEAEGQGISLRRRDSSPLRGSE